MEHLVKLAARLTPEKFGINEYLIEICKESDRTIKGHRLSKDGSKLEYVVVRKDSLGVINTEEGIKSVAGIALMVICRKCEVEATKLRLRKRMSQELIEYVKQIKSLVCEARKCNLVQ